MVSARRWMLLPLVPLLVTSWLTTPAVATEGPGANGGAIEVPGAEFQRVECHPDLSATTLAAKGRSDISDWAGCTRSRR